MGGKLNLSLVVFLGWVLFALFYIGYRVDQTIARLDALEAQQENE